jgi:hypothetical protein
MPRHRPLAARPLDQPAASRFPADARRRAEALAEHAAALGSGAPGYRDPETGLFVLTAAFLARRGTCCDNGCRHCPYVDD